MWATKKVSRGPPQFCIVLEIFHFEIDQSRDFFVLYVLLLEKRRIAPEPCTVEVDRVIHIFVAHIKGFQNHIWFMGIGVEVQVVS
jgi:hypothetical protein